jgi:hypothetical protein
MHDAPYRRTADRWPMHRAAPAGTQAPRLPCSFLLETKSATTSPYTRNVPARYVLAPATDERAVVDCSTQEEQLGWTTA